MGVQRKTKYLKIPKKNLFWEDSFEVTAKDPCFFPFSLDHHEESIKGFSSNESDQEVLLGGLLG